MNIQKVLGAAFFIEQLWWMLLNYVLVSGSGEITFDLISLLDVQIQELKSRSTTTRNMSFLQNLLNLIITKYLKQEVDDDLIFFVDNVTLVASL